MQGTTKGAARALATLTLVGAAACADDALINAPRTAPRLATSGAVAQTACTGPASANKGFKLTCGAATIVTNDTLRFAVSGGQANWQVADTAVARVDASGLVKGVRAGTTTLVATKRGGQNVAVSAKLTVVAPAVAPAPVTPAPVTPAPVPPVPPPVDPAPPADTAAVGAAAGAAELPRVYLQTGMPAPTGRTIAVGAGGDLQAALDAAQPGDVVSLAPGAAFVGNFVLRPKAGMGPGQWVTVRSAGALPAEGTRVGPADAAQMPKLLTPNAVAALATAPGAQGWRLTGLEIAATAQAPLVYALVAFGAADGTQAAAAQVPARLVLDRSYVHGLPQLNMQRCVALNSAATAVVDSYLAECHGNYGDSQGIAGWNGPGPYKIVNNYVEGGHEVILFGGADPTIAGMLPADIEIRRNHVTRPAAWRGVWQAKNLLEFKAGQRVLVEANVFENNWVHAQNGFAFVWWSVNQDGGCTWCVTEDVTFRYNRVRDVAGGFNLATVYTGAPARPMRRVTIAHNVVTGLDGSNGRMYQVSGSIADLAIVSNSGLGVSHSLMFATPEAPLPSLVFRDNVTGGEYSLFASGGAMGARSLALLQVPAANVTGNVIQSGSGAGSVPPGNRYVAAPAEIGFADYAAGDLRLTAAGLAAAGGTRPGADVARVDDLTRSVVR